jgi:hypothetical protein
MAPNGTIVALYFAARRTNSFFSGHIRLYLHPFELSLNTP